MYLKHKRKIDIAIFLLFFLGISSRILFINSDARVISVVLDDAVLSCKQNKKYDKYTGYFSLNGLTLSSRKSYESCQSFKDAVAGKNVKGNYLSENNLLVDITIDKKVYYERSFARHIFLAAFLSIIAWALTRHVTFWLWRKYA